MRRDLCELFERAERPFRVRERGMPHGRECQRLLDQATGLMKQRQNNLKAALLLGERGAGRSVLRPMRQYRRSLRLQATDLRRRAVLLASGGRIAG